ncbi:MAG: hypothetical protein COB50_03910, partial [Thiotrichales bacterium]
MINQKEQKLTAEEEMVRLDKALGDKTWCKVVYACYKEHLKKEQTDSDTVGLREVFFTAFVHDVKSVDDAEDFIEGYFVKDNPNTQVIADLKNMMRIKELSIPTNKYKYKSSNKIMPVPDKTDLEETSRSRMTFTISSVYDDLVDMMQLPHNKKAIENAVVALSIIIRADTAYFRLMSTGETTLDYLQHKFFHLGTNNKHVNLDKLKQAIENSIASQTEKTINAIRIAAKACMITVSDIFTEGLKLQKDEKKEKKEKKEILYSANNNKGESITFIFSTSESKGKNFLEDHRAQMNLFLRVNKFDWMIVEGSNKQYTIEHTTANKAKKI